jgi:hypothetical protein
MWEVIFPKNVHPVERALRVIVGLAVLSLVFVGPKSLWGLLGIAPVIAGFLGSCPLYTLLGISTCPLKQDKAPQGENKG